MRSTIRRSLVTASLAFTLMAMAVYDARADELIGKVKSVDVEGKKVVITDGASNKEIEVTIGAKTSWTKEKKGKPSKKFDLTKLKVGTAVEVTHEGSIASTVLIKEKKKKTTL